MNHTQRREILFQQCFHTVQWYVQVRGGMRWNVSGRGLRVCSYSVYVCNESWTTYIL